MGNPHDTDLDPETNPDKDVRAYPVMTIDEYALLRTTRKSRQPVPNWYTKPVDITGLK